MFQMYDFIIITAKLHEDVNSFTEVTEDSGKRLLRNVPLIK